MIRTCELCPSKLSRINNTGICTQNPECRLENRKRQHRMHPRKKKPHAGFALPEDGIIDPLAVDLTVSGERMVRLTPGERQEAARLLIAKGVTFNEMRVRMGVTHPKARQLVQALGYTTRDKQIVRQKW